MDELVIKVTLTDDLRTVALDYIVDELGGDDRLEEAFRATNTGMILRSRYRIEADMICVIADALRRRAYTD